MDTAERDQYQAAARDWAQNLRIDYDSLVTAGFEPEQATTLLCARFMQGAAYVQASAMDRMTDTMNRMERGDG